MEALVVHHPGLVSDGLAVDLLSPYQQCGEKSYLHP